MATSKKVSLEHYYYADQLRDHMIQFMAIFSGLQVSIGKNDVESDSDLITVPILYGSRDRVVSHVFTEHTQNKMIRLPIMSANLNDIQLALDYLKGVDEIRKDVRLPLGGAIPDDLTRIDTYQSIPYRTEMELGFHCSNTRHRFEMLEQILMLFSPTIQIQVSDNFGNRQNIIAVNLENIQLDENYPAGEDRRIISDIMTFSFIMYLTPPANLRNKIVKDIKIRMQTLNDINSTPADMNQGIDPFLIINSDGAPTS